MLSVKGRFQNGVALPSEVVSGQEGRPVIITFLDEPDRNPDSGSGDRGYHSLNQLIEDCQLESGLKDLAHQHDHYLYGTPKRP